DRGARRRDGCATWGRTGNRAGRAGARDRWTRGRPGAGRGRPASRQLAPTTTAEAEEAVGHGPGRPRDALGVRRREPALLLVLLRAQRTRYHARGSARAVRAPQAPAHPARGRR